MFSQIFGLEAEYDPFQLLGHDNPFGRYPSPVVPIGKFNGRLVAVCAGERGPELLNVADDAMYVRYDATLIFKLHGFNYQTHRLFAFSEKDVSSYYAPSEAAYFSQLLADPEFSATNPFLRFSFAKVVSEPTVLIEELYNCVATLRRTSEEFLDTWYERQREALLSSIDKENQFFFPPTWKVLLRIQELRRPAVTRAGHSFISAPAQSGGPAATGAAMGTALVAVALLSTRTSLESAYQLLLDRNYSYRDIGILMAHPAFLTMFPELQGSSPTHHQPDPQSVLSVFEDREYARIGDLKIVCAGPYARNFGGVSADMMTQGADLVANPLIGLTAAGLSDGQAQTYVEGLRHGKILMGVASVPDSDASFFSNDWV
jgi:hypothetical protein